MSDHINNKLWLIGAGNMAIEYARILKEKKIMFEVIGRGEESATAFFEKTGVKVLTGGVADQLRTCSEVPTTAIVAVGVEELADTVVQLLKVGVKRILVEKPAGLNLQQICRVVHAAEQFESEVFVGYNRRFYSSVLHAQRIIEADGGVKSFHFEFTEWSHLISCLKKAPGVKDNWFLANSTHVVDLAFFLGGKPKDISCFISGTLDWHPTASAFSGAGVTEGGALFSYQADWEAPGRWGLEVMTRKHRLIFRPLEQLHIQKNGSITVEKVDLDDDLDLRFKPGLYKQVEAFICGVHNQSMIDIFDHYNMVSRWYEKISCGSFPAKEISISS